MITRKEWATKFLKEIGAPITQRNLWAVVAWTTAEGTRAKFNPLSCVQVMPGSWLLQGNTAGVQNYPDLATGLKATAKTIRSKTVEYNYGPILSSLLGNGWARDTLLAIEDSAWGTGGLALDLLDDVKGHWEFYSTIPIGQ